MNHFVDIRYLFTKNSLNLFFIKLKLSNQLNFSTHSGWVGIRNIYDYSAFGVLLPERTVEGEFFRRSFNGMETDTEVKEMGIVITLERECWM